MRRSAIELGTVEGSLEFPYAWQLGHIRSIAVSPVNGSIFVSDCGNSQIHVFDVGKRHVRTFGQHGKEEGQLTFPKGIDVSVNGQVYVANQDNGCVSVFREDGTFIRTIGQGTLNRPWDVLVHRSGLVYVADSYYHHIAVFLPDGEVTRTFKLQEGMKGQFVCSCGMAVYTQMAATCTSVTVITTESKSSLLIIRASISWNLGLFQLKYLRGVTVTSDGSVLVTDSGNNHVAVFDENGKFVHSLPIKDPAGLAVDSRGDLLVASLQKSVCYF